MKPETTLRSNVLLCSRMNAMHFAAPAADGSHLQSESMMTASYGNYVYYFVSKPHAVKTMLQLLNLIMNHNLIHEHLCIAGSLGGWTGDVCSLITHTLHSSTD